MSILEQLQIKPTPSSKIMQAEFGRRIIENLDVGYNRYELMQRLFGARPQKTPAPLAKKPAQKAAPKPLPQRIDDTIEEVDIDDKIKARLPPPKQHETGFISTN